MTNPRHLLLTGVTGFVGKVVLEELCRRRKELKIETIYVLIRPRKEQSAAERFAKEVVASECFSALPAHWERLVKVLSSDLTDLDLDAETRLELADRLTHVIHCAASVAFDLPIQEAAAANVTSALKLLELAQSCPKIQQFVDVSTAYVTPHSGRDQPIPEALVELGVDPEALYADILAGRVEEATLLKQLGHPNTYTLTKCLSEHMLCRRKGQVPLAILRPSIIAASWQHPQPGWIDSYAAFAGFVGLIGAGILKFAVAREDTVLDIVPCDEVSHRIISTAFAVTPPPLVQHVVTGVDRGSRIDTCIGGIESYFQRHPVQFWPGIKRLSNGGSVNLHHWRLHRLPALMAGTWYGIRGQQRQRRQVQKVQARIEYLNTIFVYFTHHTFRFEMANPLSIADFEPKQYIERVCRGVHANLMRSNPAETLLAGAEHKYPKSDLAWARLQPNGNWAIRTAAYFVRKGLRRSNQRITFDRSSFERAMAQVSPESLLLLVPSHRSYMDFLLCSYLVFAHPELNISLPRIAAASDFAKIPVLGWFFQKTHAFYIQRGQGKADPALNGKIQELVSQHQSLEFFVEGTRSRSRQFLTPRRGILRAIQGTGVTCQLLPIAFSYDHVPEERSFLKALRGQGQGQMKLSSLLKWTGRLLLGKVQLGRVHIACGQPLSMDAQTDIPELSREIMAQLQDQTTVSTLHLQAFLLQVPGSGLDLPWLIAAIQARGGQVIDSPLAATQAIDPLTERSMRFHWLHYFYPEALALAPGNPALLSHVRRNAYLPVLSQPAAKPEQDPRLSSLLRALFEPLGHDYQQLIALACQQQGLPANAQVLVRQCPGSFLPVVEEALQTLQEQQLLVPDGAGKLVPGARGSELKAFAEACRWQTTVQIEARSA